MENFYVGQQMMNTVERAEEASSLDPQCTTLELTELNEMSTLGCWPFMHAFLRQWKMKAFLTCLMMKKFSLHHVYVPRINRSLNEFIQQMNNHPLSTENQSTLQMWEQGMLENIPFGHTALSSEETEDFGVDQGGALSVEEEDYQVNVISPLTNSEPKCQVHCKMMRIEELIFFSNV